MRKKPVVGFTPDALSKAANLEELTLPASIGVLPDSVFAACGKLARLILQHTDRPCGISEHRQDSAGSVRIFVPTAAYPLYQDGYGCETNPWSPLLNRIFTYT